VIIFYISNHRRRSSVNIGGKTFLPENVCTSKSGQNFGGGV